MTDKEEPKTTPPVTDKEEPKTTPPVTDKEEPKTTPPVTDKKDQITPPVDQPASAVDGVANDTSTKTTPKPAAVDPKDAIIAKNNARAVKDIGTNAGRVGEDLLDAGKSLMALDLKGAKVHFDNAKDPFQAALDAVGKLKGTLPVQDVAKNPPQQESGSGLAKEAKNESLAKPDTSVALGGGPK